METLSRRINNTFGTWAGFKRHTLRHGKTKSLSSIVAPFQGSHLLHHSYDPDKMEAGGGGVHTRLGHNRSASAASTQGSIGSTTSRSISMNSVNSDGSNESPMVVEQEHIVALTHDVRGFKEALSKLRKIFHPERDKQETTTVRGAAHERLGEVLRILRSILERYAPLQSTELLMAAGQLIQQIKGFNFEDVRADPTEFFEAIDQLALAFSNRVSEYLMGDLDTSSTVHPAARSRSCENLPTEEENGALSTGICKYPEILTPQQIDETLMRLEQGVNVALQRAKVWSKYAKDVITYIEKRSALEGEYARNMLKLAQAMRPMLKEESYLPFQSIYCAALDQDAEIANLCQATCSLLQGHKFIEPLTARRNEHEKARKQIKELWQREMKRMQDAISNLRKARSLYYQRQLEYEKARDSLQRVENLEGTETSKLDKKKKLEDDALQKAIEAETTYKACVVEANERHQIMQKVKSDVLKQVRELVLQCDQTMKAVTVGYFQLQHTVSAPCPVQFQTLCESSRLYEPGSQYMEFVKRISVPPDAPIFEPPPFSFEPYTPTDSRLQDRVCRTNGTLEGSDESLGPSPSSQSSENSKDKLRIGQPMKAWGASSVAPLAVSDSDSISSSQSNKSVDMSPYSSPQTRPRRLGSGPTDDIDIDGDCMDGVDISPRGLSKAAMTHALRRLKTPSRCRECDTYVYFQGIECTECALACHKKCAETLAIQCGHKRLPPKLSTFGVDLSQHVQDTQTEIPQLVSRCIQAIDERGIDIKGIYRVSGVKSRVEKLCQSFENGVDLVDLSDIHPNIIANVLKLYLRQLPEPLLTYRWYPELIHTAKMYPHKGSECEEELKDDLKAVVRRLPRPHYATLAVLMQHLRRVTENADVNNMPASNLGIVFGPTLLRSSEGGASLSSLIDTVYQTRVIELLIINAEALFGSTGSKVLSRKVLPRPVEELGQDSKDIVGAAINESEDSHSMVPDDDYEQLPGYLRPSWEKEDDPVADDNDRDVADELATGANSEDELPDDLLPDHSKKMLLKTRLSTQSADYQDEEKITKGKGAATSPSSKLKKCLSDGDAVLRTCTDSDSSSSRASMPSPLESVADHKCLSVDSISDTDSGHPVPPPRRHSSQQRLNRSSPSPAPSDSDSVSLRSVSPAPSVGSHTQVVASTDRIVIHVQGESCCDSSSAKRGGVPGASDNCRLLTVVSTHANDMESFDEESYVDDAVRPVPSDATCCSTITKVVDVNSLGDAASVKCSKPVPSPRISRIVATKTVSGTEAGVIPSAAEMHHHIPVDDDTSSVELPAMDDGPSGGGGSVQRDYSPHPGQQPSPVSSIPSTSSSMDELDGFSSGHHGEYISPYLTADPYRNLRLGTGSPLVYARTSTFANYDEPCRVRVSAIHDTAGDTRSTPAVSRGDEAHESVSVFSRLASRTSSLPANELGSRNSLLRTATRHTRYSPAYSTASTKSSGSSSSPPPEMEDGLISAKEASHLDSRGNMILSIRDDEEEDETCIHNLHRVSSDSSMFVKRGGATDAEEEDGQKRRAPQYV